MRLKKLQCLMTSGDLGGVFGLTFGASILTVFELFEFCIGLIFSGTCCLPWQSKSCRKFKLPKQNEERKIEKEDAICTIVVNEKELEVNNSTNLIANEDILLY